ncbi:hypothetical protein MMC11_002744 [Xylographa trunciseda]|nr:hypothetical protein [Xylographa trunciseda]
MSELGIESGMTAIEKEDPRLIALHQVALRAEEAAARLNSHAVATQPLLSSLAPKPAFRVPWTAPLTPDDSAEENSDILEPVITREPPYPILAASTTPLARPSTLTMKSPTSSGKKRGRPRKLNLIDSIVDQGQTRSTVPAIPKRKGRPPGISKSRTREQRLASSNLKILKPAPANAEGLKIYVGSRLIDRNGKNVLSQDMMQFIVDLAAREFGEKRASFVDPRSKLSNSLTPSVSLNLNDSRMKVEEENNILKTIFNNEIAPIMHSAMIGFEDKLPRDTLVAVGRAFVDEILNMRLRIAVQDGLRTVTPLFKQIAKGTIQRMLLQKARDHETMSLSSAWHNLDGVGNVKSALISETDAESGTNLDGVSRPKRPPIGVFRRPGHYQKQHDGNKAVQPGSQVHAITPLSSVPDWNLTMIDRPNQRTNTNILQDTASQNLPLTVQFLKRSLSPCYGKPADKDSHFQTQLPPAALSEPFVKFETDQRGPSSEITRKQTLESYPHTLHESASISQSPALFKHQPFDSDDSMPRRLTRHPGYINKSTPNPEATSSAPDKARKQPIQRLRAGNSETSKLLPAGSNDEAVDFSIYCVPQRVRNTTSILCYRERGIGKWNKTALLSIQHMDSQLKMNIAEELGCWRTWTGASKDVVTAAWAPDGCSYAAGASTEMDNLNIQYNRNNNLLLGNLEANTLKELPDHYVNRPTPDMIDGGDNALEDTYNSVDPELYTTVSHVCFSQDSSRLFTASYDNTVKIWDLQSTSKPVCVKTILHDAHVELLTTSHQPSNLLASGQRSIENSIRLFDLGHYDHGGHNFSSALHTYTSPRASKFNLFPTCLLWGRTSYTSNLLLAGFAEETEGDFGYAQNGELCLWDVETGKSLKLLSSSNAIHDISWHPRLPVFAAASSPGSRYTLTHRSTRSIVRTYQPYDAPSYRVEYECPALDINDIQFHPRDDHYISAGCTDGVTYVWDVRRPETILHRLTHGLPIDELDHSVRREEQDTGVRFQAWDEAGQHLLTGSSDGAIKAWDIFVSPEDAFVKDVAQFDAGVMTGSFSPNYDNLLVGLSKGAVHILSVCPTTHDPAEDSQPLSHRSSLPRKAYDAITYIPAPRPTVEAPPSGSTLATHLLATKQLTMHHIFGAGKGPNYQGPYARYARRDGTDPANEDLDPNILASQLDPLQRRRGREAGGKADKKTVGRYRMAAGLAHERNFMRYAFREKNRAAGKRSGDEEGAGGGGGKRERVEDEEAVSGVWWEGEPEDEEDGEDVDTKAAAGEAKTTVRVSEAVVAKVGAAAARKAVAEREIIVIDDD